MLGLDSYKQDILNKLEAAGAKGLTKSGLGISGSKSAKADALKSLEAEGLVADLGNKQRRCYVLQEFNTPLEFACEKIETIMTGKPILFSQTKLKELTKKGTPAKVVKEIPKAIAQLAREKKLLKLKYGKNFLFVHVSAIHAMLPVAPVISEKKDVSELAREKVLAAYQKVKARLGFSNVEIYELQQELGVPMEQVKSFLLEESQKGKAILSFGDWSLSSEEIRSGAVYINDKPHLLVRFKEK